MSRRGDVTIGVLAMALGLIGLAAAVFGPATYSYGVNWLSAGSRSLWDVGLGTGSVPLYLAVMAAAALGVGLGMMLHGSGRGAAALVLLWASALVFAGGAFLTLPGMDTAVVPSALHTHTPDSVGIGGYLVLPALVALAAAFIATATRPAPHQPPALSPL